MARAWSARDPVAALAWASEQADLNLRETLIAAAAPQAVWRDPKLAIDTVAALPEGTARDQAVSRMTSNWAQRDPAAAADFAVTNPLSESQRSAIAADVGYQWSRRTSAEAAGWVAGIPADQGRWNALLGAAAGAAKFSDGSVIGAWRQAMRRPDLNATEAEQWLLREEIPSDVREQFLPLVRQTP